MAKTKAKNWQMAGREKQRIMITLDPLMVEAAELMISEQSFTSLSEFLSHLLREAWANHKKADPFKTEVQAAIRRMTTRKQRKVTKKPIKEKE